MGATRPLTVMDDPLPPIRGLADIEALEKTPFAERPTDRTVYELVRGGALIDPDKAAFLNLPAGNPREEPVAMTYGEFLSNVHRAANLFRHLGIGPGDSVGVLLPIVPQNFIVMIGAATAGILCPVNWMLKPVQISGILKAVEAKILIALAPADSFDIWEKACVIAKEVDSLEHILQVALPGASAEPDKDFDLLLKEQRGTGLDFPLDAGADDIAIHAHTGGTTGTPKIAQLRHRAIAYKVWAYSNLLATQADHMVFAGSPLFHIGGIIYHTINSLAHGATSLVIGPMGFSNKDIIENYWYLIERYGITDFFGVPTTLSALANVPPGGADISSLRPYTMTGSAGLPVGISSYFEREIGVRILSNYGMTENTATITLPPRNGDPKFGSSGIRLPYTHVRIVKLGQVGENAVDCATDEIGDILIKGPGVISGYLDERFNNALFLEDGWLLTGDLGRLDEDGYLWVTGRAKDLIIRSGNNIDPLIIEEALLRHC